MIDLDSIPRAHSEQDFLAWIVDAKPGDSIEYFRGDSVGRGSGRNQDLAWRVREEADKGRVHLVQQRIGPVPAPACVGEFSYLAQRARTR